MCVLASVSVTKCIDSIANREIIDTHKTTTNKTLCAYMY